MVNDLEFSPFQQFHQIPLLKIKYFQKRILQWFSLNKRNFPWRKDTSTAYEILIAELLLQQTDAKKIQNVFNDFISDFPNINVLASAKIISVEKYIDRIGLKYRAERLIGIAQTIVKDFNGIIPNREDHLRSIRGIGPYIANAVLSSAFNERVSIVDTNIIRLFQRYFCINSQKSRPRDDPELWKIANLLIPRRLHKPIKWNYALLDFTGVICTHYRPSCKKCICFKECIYYQMTSAK